MLSSWPFQSTTSCSALSLSARLCRCRSLGPLNYMRIWHDNSGRGAAASWFLKYVIVCDLQTMEKSYFISQQWLAVEKDDGMVSMIDTATMHGSLTSTLDRTSSARGR